jgi:hypothetical protein
MASSISNIVAKLGLYGTFTPGKQGVSNANRIGSADSTIKLTDATKFYLVRAIFAGSSDVLELDLTTNDTTGSTAWVAGAAQVETATAAGTITVSGNATVIVTAAGMTGSPKTITVAVVSGDTATLWAAKARTALAADAAVAAMFTVSGATTAIILTRKPLATFTTEDGPLNVYAANDGTLNMALADDTSTGITEAASSANTTAGVASDGVKIYGGGGVDHQGDALGTLTEFRGLRFQVEGYGLNAVGGTSEVINLQPGEDLCRASATVISVDSAYTFTADGSKPAAITITVAGL